MSLISEQSILAVLSKLDVPGTKQDIVSAGLVSGLSVDQGEAGAGVSFVLEVSPEQGPKMEPLRAAAERLVADMDGVAKVSVVLTAHSKAGQGTGVENEKLPLLPGVKKIIAVASGKGGVGKSTTAVNIAVAMALNGLKVGLLDADVYGPSIPRLMGLGDITPDVDEETGIQPLNRHGIVCMSIGFLVPEEKPMIWRGPMVHSALQQLLRDVNWGELDVLVVDMPPGTGDAQLTIAQQVPLAGVVIVSTPQDIALVDARKGLEMFRRMDVPVLGIIENMSYFLCPHCGARSDVFSNGGAEKEARRLGVKFLGAVPLDVALRELSDAGRPIAEAMPGCEHANIYKQIAFNIADAMRQS